MQRINEIIRGKRGITPATAWLHAQAFGTTPQFRVNLQANHDLASSRSTRSFRKLESRLSGRIRPARHMGPRTSPIASRCGGALRG